MLGAGAHGVERLGPPLSALQEAVLAAVGAGLDSSDRIAAETDLTGAEIAIALADLEARGYLTCSLVGAWSRTGLAAPAPD